jgi:integrase
VLSTLLGYAVENKVIAKVTLRCHVRGRKAEDAPILAVEAHDVPKLLGAADLTYRVAILLATEAGFRVGEIRGLQWTDIRGDEVTIRRAIDSDDNVGAPKHDRVRKVPLSPGALDGASKAPQASVVGAVRGRRRAAAVPGDARYAAPDLPARWRGGAGLGGRHDGCRGTRSGTRSARSAPSAGCRSRRSATSWATRTSRRRFATSR